MTDQTVSQRCRLQARSLVAQRPKTILQAQETLPYPSFCDRASSESGTSFTDIPINECLRNDCYAIESHIHSYGKAKYVKDEGCSSTEVETPSAGQTIPSLNFKPSGLASVDPAVDEKPRGNSGPKIPAPHHAKSKDLNSALCALTVQDHDSMVSTSHSRTTAPYESDVKHAGRDWHTSLAIRPRRQAQEDRTNVGGC